MDEQMIVKVVMFDRHVKRRVSVREYFNSLAVYDDECGEIEDFNLDSWQLERDGKILQADEFLYLGEYVVITRKSK